jgi:hypothetical protein
VPKGLVVGIGALILVALAVASWSLTRARSLLPAETIRYSIDLRPDEQFIGVAGTAG